MNTSERRDQLLSATPDTITAAHGILKLSVPQAVRVLRKAGKLTPSREKRIIQQV